MATLDFLPLRLPLSSGLIYKRINYSKNEENYRAKNPAAIYRRKLHPKGNSSKTPFLKFKRTNGTQIRTLAEIPSTSRGAQDGRLEMTAAPPEVPTLGHPSTPPTDSVRIKSVDGEPNEDVHSQKAESPGFQWTKNWYPVALVEDLDPSVPTAVQLLGMDLVLWKAPPGSDSARGSSSASHAAASNSESASKQGEESKDASQPFNSAWRVFLDLCPHRLAPLSEGRLDEKGRLECSYHGWSFKGDGSCASIPQASATGPESRAIASPRACAAQVPATVSQGLLFVWPEIGGQEEASKKPVPRLPPAFEDPEFATVTIQRDLFYGYDTLMENVSDPSHINFAHHKVTGRRDRAQPLPFHLEGSGPWGFSGSTVAGTEPKMISRFEAPSYMINKIELHPFRQKPAFMRLLLGDPTWQIWICSFNVPLAPGKTRSIVCSARNFARFTVPGPAWWQQYPRWLEHLESNKVYDGDMIVLQGQEKALVRKDMRGEGSSYSQMTFTPAGADRFVLEFRNWLRKHGGGAPSWIEFSRSSSNGLFSSQTLQDGESSLPLPSTVLNRQQMLDRLSQHTKKCSSCSSALKGFQRAVLVLGAASVLLLAGATIPNDIYLRAALAAASVACALGAAIGKLFWERQFLFVDYVHSQIE